MEAGICLALFFMVSHIIILLLDDGWMKAEGYIDSLKEIYSAIYQGDRLQFETETFYEECRCVILYSIISDQTGNC